MLDLLPSAGLLYRERGGLECFPLVWLGSPECGEVVRLLDFAFCPRLWACVHQELAMGNAPVYRGIAMERVAGIHPCLSAPRE